MKKNFTLAGNPNSGKTTFFNELTGSRQRVGNYPGVTVEKKEGFYNLEDVEIRVTDLPGTYSLSAYSLEERVARDFLINTNQHMVINIVDASNLERNLYLTVQLFEMELPVIIALNMMDVASQRGIEIDHEKLSHLLSIPVVPTIARSGKGLDDVIKKASKADKNSKFKISYGEDIDSALDKMEKLIREENFLTDKFPARWTALKYIEEDKDIINSGKKYSSEISFELELISSVLNDHIKNTLDTYPEAIIADYRYGFIKSITKQCVKHKEEINERLFISDKIDQIATNRFLGPIIMIGVIFSLYKLTFGLSEIPVSWFESFFGMIGGVIGNILPDGTLKSLIMSGIVDGVGGVLGFVPIIFFMFLGISILEDSGYFARIAFMLDRVFKFFGLHGSSVMPFIISGGIAGGCAVPGVMAARTLKSRKERIATILTVPFMNCGAKIPVFMLLVAAFFPENKTMVMMLITLISWAGALITAKILRLTIIRGESTPFVMELPPYRLPTFKGIMIHTFERTWMYIKKAGTVILAISIVLWALMTFPGLSTDKQMAFENEKQTILSNASKEVLAELENIEGASSPSDQVLMIKNKIDALEAQKKEEELKNSIAGRTGVALESISRFAGFDWRVNISLIGGFAAKEVIVSTLGTAYSLGEVDPEDAKPLSETLAKSNSFNMYSGLALIIFIIFYAPCFVTVVNIAKETGSWKWAFFSMGFNTTLAFFLAVLVYQAGSIL